MKIVKNSVIFIISLSLVLPLLSWGEKRNLSTPKSRLLGHWVRGGDIRTGVQWYFAPDESLVCVNPDKKALVALAEKATEEMKRQGKEVTKEDIERIRKATEEGAGKAVNYYYKVDSQKPDGEEIDISMYDAEELWRGKIIIYQLTIDKYGKKMEMKPFDKETFQGMSEYLRQEWETNHFWVYVDAKTSPEDNK
jgi:hypothetical protein